LADRYTLQDWIRFFQVQKRLEVEIESCWRAFFSILLKKLDWEWVLEILGDGLSVVHLWRFRFYFLIGKQEMDLEKK
jgi:hypothetical protein